MTPVPYYRVMPKKPLKTSTSAAASLRSLWRVQGRKDGKRCPHSCYGRLPGRSAFWVACLSGLPLVRRSFFCHRVFPVLNQISGACNAALIQSNSAWAVCAGLQSVLFSLYTVVNAALGVAVALSSKLWHHSQARSCNACNCVIS